MWATPFKAINRVFFGGDGIGIATTDDIVAMRLHAIINSGKHSKDNVDIVFLSQYYCIEEIKDLLLQKYPAYNPIMIDIAITYLEDTDMSFIPSIKMLQE